MDLYGDFNLPYVQFSYFFCLDIFGGGVVKKESEFQKNLKKEIIERFPESKIIRLNPNDNWSGIPDLLVLNGNKWAALECKRNDNASHRTHQDYYVDQMNDMSYAAFIYPENKEEVLNELSAVFKT